MSYLEWFISHGKKHRKIVDKISYLSDDEIVEYFRFENMLKFEPNFCPLYIKKIKCHSIDDLNCYLCGCPYFLFDDEVLKVDSNSNIVKSLCSIDAKDSAFIEHNGIVHLNCSFCELPHKESFIKKHFHRGLVKIMKM